MQSTVFVADHAIQRYNQRSKNRGSFQQVIKIIRHMWENGSPIVKAIQTADPAKFRLYNGWVLVCVGEKISTLFQARDLESRWRTV